MHSKVLHIVPHMRQGTGIAKTVCEIVNGMQNEDIEFYILPLKKSEPVYEVENARFFNYEQTAKMGNISGQTLQIRKILSTLPLSYSIVRDMTREGIDIVHSFTRAADPILTLAKLKGFKTIRTQQNAFPGKNAAFKKYAMFWNHLYDQWTAVGPSVKKHIIDRWGIRESKIEIINNGANVNVFKPLTETERRRLRSRYNWGKDAIICISVGSLSAKKNHAEMIEAFASAKKICPGLILAIAGEGIERKALENNIRKLNLDKSVQLLGLRHDVPDLLSAADIYVHSAWSEGLSLAVAEAAAAGLPVIGFNVEGVLDIVKHGETGMLLSLHDLQGFGQAIIDLAEDDKKRKRVGRAGREFAMREFSIDAIVEAYKRVYMRLLP